MTLSLPERLQCTDYGVSDPRSPSGRPQGPRPVPALQARPGRCKALALLPGSGRGGDGDRDEDRDAPPAGGARSRPGRLRGLPVTRPAPPPLARAFQRLTPGGRCWPGRVRGGLLRGGGETGRACAAVIGAQAGRACAEVSGPGAVGVQRRAERGRYAAAVLTKGPAVRAAVTP